MADERISLADLKDTLDQVQALASLSLTGELATSISRARHYAKLSSSRSTLPNVSTSSMLCAL